MVVVADRGQSGGQLLLEFGDPSQCILEPINGRLNGALLVEKVSVLAEFSQQAKLNLELTSSGRPS